MPTVYVTEYSGVGMQSGPLAIGNTPPMVFSNNVAITAGSLQSNPFNANTKMIRIHTDAICSIAIGGTNPTATAADARFAANQTEYFWVNPAHRLAVIINT